MRISILCFMTICGIYDVMSIEPVTTLIGVSTVTVALVGMAGMAVKCRIFECCTPGQWLQDQVPSKLLTGPAICTNNHLSKLYW